MNILFLTPWYPDSLSSTSGVFIQTQARALGRQHSVTVISCKVDPRNRALSSWHVDIEEQGSLQEHRMIIKKSLPLFNQLHYLWIASRYSYRIAKSFKPDIIHASIGYPGAILGWIVSRLLRRPFVFTEHTRPKNNFRSVFHKLLTVFGLKKASAVIAVSHFLAKELQPFVRSKVIVQPNVMDVSAFINVPLPVNDDTIHIGFIGGMNTEVKGLDLLLEALAGINHKEFVLHIGGDGKLIGEYKAKAEALGVGSHCIFYGILPHSEIPDFISRTHFFVCSSRSETFNVALIEAMACGRPVVSTRCGGPEDFVNQKNGLLVEKEDVPALRNGIEQMMDTYSSYDALEIRREASEKFSKETFLKNMNELYFSTLDLQK